MRKYSPNHNGYPPNDKSTYPLNPKTGKKWNFGETREDGYIFVCYRSKVNKDNQYKANFKSPEVVKRENEKHKPLTTTKRRLNPKTGKEFKQGDMSEDGRYFVGYISKRNKENYFYEKWCDEDQFLRAILSRSLSRYKTRAKKDNRNFNLDLDYLVDIFPKDYRCPVLGITLDFITEKKFKPMPNSPSLDRIDNDKGYVKGNVVWVSNKVNLIKSVSTVDELNKVYNFYKNL